MTNDEMIHDEWVPLDRVTNSEDGIELFASLGLGDPSSKKGDARTGASPAKNKTNLGGR